eukprot:TRINITY_DN74706_c0_g1_i1.p1 TRINITY_DN74706_c0_g1~~TRINITY_DN74706_c0_g1_i1.p1  ORF type:complete len:586 (+),score=97.78 TRINITY_DN74706_c0_g1_i1:211-1758(+)
MAFATLLTTEGGPEENFNPHLKMLLTSGGLMPTSVSNQIQTYYKMFSQTAGQGILYLLDAKMYTLQFQRTMINPEKVNNEKYVAYKREPDVPGGMPVRVCKPACPDGNSTCEQECDLVMKTQEELMHIGYASALYTLKHAGHYSNGHVRILQGPEGNVETPVYLSYLWYDGEVLHGAPEFKILLGQGLIRGGNFIAKKTNGEEFTDDDYSKPWATTMDSTETAFFQNVSPAEFERVVQGVKTIFSCGGDTFLTIKALQPSFRDRKGDLVKRSRNQEQPNPYGLAVLNAVKSGSVIYVGQSAGTVAMSWIVGALTKDPSSTCEKCKFDILKNESSAEQLDLGPEGLLGKTWLFPGLGEYLNIPYRLVLRPHLDFKNDCSFTPNARSLLVLSEFLAAPVGAFKHNVYGVVMSDYNFSTGSSDMLEISGKTVRYHVGFCPQSGALISDDVRAKVGEMYPEWLAQHVQMPCQPSGNSPEGWSFTWQPSDGDVYAAGPKAKRPFRMFADMHGPLSEAPPS